MKAVNLEYRMPNDGSNPNTPYPGGRSSGDDEGDDKPKGGKDEDKGKDKGKG